MIQPYHPFRATCALLLLTCAWTARAHPLVENALDVVISPDKIVIDARISMEEVLMAGATGSAMPAREQWPGLVQAHGSYVLRHLRVNVDGRFVEGKVAPIDAGEVATPASLVAYRFEYPLDAPPLTVRLDQSLLREFEAWSVSCIVRIRQNDQPDFQTDFLPREKTVEFGCTWPPGTIAGPTTAPQKSAGTHVRLGPTIREYAWEGIRHILTGYDHLLFVSALVLAATKLWDLIKVVTAFTLAHTVTLTLSVLKVVVLGKVAVLVEPMVALSIVFVAVQNIFWPERSRGWARLAIAFGFGLFHGLAFADGLRDAMSAMPPAALWAALAAFSIGVEVGHQIVLLPLFGTLQFARHWNTDQPRTALMADILRFGSSAIAVAGMYFLFQTLPFLRQMVGPGHR